MCSIILSLKIANMHQFNFPVYELFYHVPVQSLAKPTSPLYALGMMEINITNKQLECMSRREFSVTLLPIIFML